MMPKFLCWLIEFMIARIYAIEKYLMVDYAVNISNNDIKEINRFKIKFDILQFTY